MPVQWTEWKKLGSGGDAVNGLSTYITSNALNTTVGGTQSNVSVTPGSGRTVQMGDIVISSNNGSLGYFGRVTDITGSTVVVTTDSCIRGAQGTPGTNGTNGTDGFTPNGSNTQVLLGDGSLRYKTAQSQNAETSLLKDLFPASKTDFHNIAVIGDYYMNTPTGTYIGNGYVTKDTLKAKLLDLGSDTTKYLCNDGTWAVPASGSVTYPISLANGGTGRDNSANTANIGFGENALNLLTGGTANVAIGTPSLNRLTTGSHNTAVGRSALINISTDDYNTAIGAFAGAYENSGSAGLTSASNSVFIGANTYGGANSRTNQIVIGYGASGYADNTITLGNNSILSSGGLRCKSTTISTLSDTRVKEDIEPANLEMCLDAVKRLPVTRYKYKDFMGDYVDVHMTGFLADDVEKVFPKSVSTHDEYFPVLDENGEKTYEDIEEVITERDEDGKDVERVKVRQVEKKFLMEDVKLLTMTEAIPTLWGAVQCLLQKVENLESEIEKLRLVKTS